MIVALLTASGTGTRMGQDIPKQFLHVKDKPVIIYTLERFQNNPPDRCNCIGNPTELVRVCLGLCQTIRDNKAEMGCRRRCNRSGVDLPGVACYSGGMH